MNEREILYVCIDVLKNLSWYGIEMLFGLEIYKIRVELCYNRGCARALGGFHHAIVES